MFCYFETRDLLQQNLLNGTGNSIKLHKNGWQQLNLKKTIVNLKTIVKYSFWSSFTVEPEFSINKHDSFSLRLCFLQYNLFNSGGNRIERHKNSCSNNYGDIYQRIFSLLEGIQLTPDYLKFNFKLNLLYFNWNWLFERLQFHSNIHCIRLLFLH